MSERTDICEKCGYWDDDSGSGFEGSCKRNAPVLTYEHARPLPRWPVIDREQWCGEFKPKEVIREREEGRLSKTF